MKTINKIKKWKSFSGGEGAAIVTSLSSCAPDDKVINSEMIEANLGYFEQVHTYSGPLNLPGFPPSSLASSGS